MATYVEMHGKVIRIEIITENCKRNNSHYKGNACKPASTKIVLLRISIQEWLLRKLRRNRMPIGRQLYKKKWPNNDVRRWS
jgi:hypothetical protein